MNKAILAIHNILTNTAGVTSLVPAVRISPIRAAQKTAYPYIVHRILTVRPVTQADSAATSDISQVSISIYSEGAGNAMTIAEAIRAALDRKAPGTYGNIRVQQVDFIGESHYPEDDAGNDQVYFIEAEYEIMFER